MRKSLVALLLVAAGGLAHAEVQLKEGHPERYTVVQGDTLWGISGRFLSKPWEWPQLWHANPQVENPHLIYPGDTLSLVYVDGAPRLSVSRGESRGTIKLSPHVRSSPAADAIPAIPLEKINSFLLVNRIADSEEVMTSAPYIVAGDAKRVVSGTGDRVYGRGDFSEPLRSYAIFRQGNTYTDPETGEKLGINLDDIGTVQLVAVEGDIATLTVTRTTQEARLADRLLPTEERPIKTVFQPSAPEAEINGLILDVPRGVTQIGAFDVVTLNKGRRDGLTEGNVLAIYKTGETVRDRLTGESVKIPDEHAGELMVFRVYDKLSYALVLKADRALAVLDKVRNP